MSRLEHKALIQAPAAQIWPWLLQMGTGRAGWYSHDWVDNFAKPSFQHIDPDLQDLKVGDVINGFKVAELIENQKLVFHAGQFASFEFELIPQNEFTLLKVKLKTKGPNWLMQNTLGLAHDFMQRKQIKEIKARAERPFSPACERNKKPILEKLQSYLGDEPTRVLEVGSGTGQHALYFTHKMPNLKWTPSDVIHQHKGIELWTQHAPKKQMGAIQDLDLSQPSLPNGQYDMIYSANVIHIVSEEKVTALFDFAAQLLPEKAKLLFYGPFQYKGQHTSESNARFDEMLRSRDPESGIRDFEWLQESLFEKEFVIKHDFEMPANNRILIFEKP